MGLKGTENVARDAIDKGTENVAKDAIEKHVKGEPHLQAVNLSKRSELGAVVYRDSVIINLPLAKSFLRLNPAERIP